MLLINQRIIDSCFSKFERRVRHNTRFKKKKQVSFLAFKEKKQCWPTTIKIAVGNVNSILAILQKPVQIALSKLNSHFGFSFAYCVGMVK